MGENITQNNTDIEVDLLEVLYSLLRRWWMILGTAVIGALLMWFVTANFITPMYESRATLYILNKTTSITSVADIQIGSYLSRDFQVIATSKPVLDGAIERLAEENAMYFTRNDILDGLNVYTVDNTRLLVIGVQNEDPEVACLIANAVAEMTATRMAEITKSDPPTMAEWAEEAMKPVSPNLFRNIMWGFAVGALLMCVILVVIFLLDDNIKTQEDVQKYLGAPTLANIFEIEERERQLKTEEGKKE